MIIYRRTPLPSAKIGKFLAKVLVLCLKPNNKRVIKEVNGVTFKLDLSQVIDMSLYLSGTFEENVEKIIGAKLQPGMIAFDIGANIGYHTFRMANLVSETGKVFAIEPAGWAYERLIINSSLNPKIKNIEFIKVGLAGGDFGFKNMCFQSSYRLDGRNESINEVIEIITLDTLIRRRKIEKVNFIKLDVDGFESKVIEGAINTLSLMKPTLLMEINPSEILKQEGSIDKMIHILLSCGYQFRTEREVEIFNLDLYCRENYLTSTMIIGEVV